MITNKIRNTCQRQYILDYLKSVDSHPTAEQVHKAVRGKLPHISLGTVYRNLRLLKEQGEVKEIPGEGYSRFDGNSHCHNHFFCKKCGKIFDFKKPTINIDKIIKENIFINSLKNYEIYLYGYCRKCKRGN